MTPTRLAIFAALLCAPAADCTAQADTPPQVRAFLTANCMDCHSADSAAAGLDLQQLAASDLTASFDKWVRVFDRVHEGEMPPADYDQPTDKQREAFERVAADWLLRTQRQEYQNKGRVQGRRLTNLQLERTLHDLLGIDIPLTVQMPEEPRTHGFNTVASGQSISHFQLQNHLTVVDAALDEAFRRAVGEPDEWTRSFSPREIARRNPRRRCREPEMLNGAAVVWSGNTTYYGRLPVTTARRPGWYRLTIRTSGLNVPEDHGVWTTVRTGMCVSSAPMLRTVGAYEVTGQTGEWTFDAWLNPGEMFEIRPGDKTLKEARFAGGQIGAGEGEPQNVAGIAHHGLTLSRIHYGPDNAAIRRLLLGDLTLRAATKKGRLPAVETERPKQVLRQLLTAFATRAFRRPVDAEQMRPYVERTMEDLQSGTRFLDALRGGYRAILCSPRFLYFEESPGRLDAWSVATRLSYLLWNTMPDEQLREAAASGGLLQREQLIQQAQRMLADERGRRFVKDFAEQWLDLSEIDFTEPDRRLYRGFDVIVQESMVGETEAFLQEMLDEDLSVSHLIDSEFTFLNNRLARHYGIEGVAGDRLQKVALKPEDRRGGVLTHGSLMKVTANGSTTSPVLRGVWISERLLGLEIPPPPAGVPAIEPDIRGAKSIRDMLEKHKSDANCASCHTKIDPAGFALENFDPAGRWRDRYPAVSRNRRKGGGIVVDAGYQFADGRAFSDLREFQQLVRQDGRSLAANVVRQLLTYGTGAPCGFADREAVSAIVDSTKSSEFGFRSLILAAVASDIFLTK